MRVAERVTPLGAIFAELVFRRFIVIRQRQCETEDRAAIGIALSP